MVTTDRPTEIRSTFANLPSTPPWQIRIGSFVGTRLIDTTDFNPKPPEYEFRLPNGCSVGVAIYAAANTATLRYLTDHRRPMAGLTVAGVRETLAAAQTDPAPEIHIVPLVDLVHFSLPTQARESSPREALRQFAGWARATEKAIEEHTQRLVRILVNRIPADLRELFTEDLCVERALSQTLRSYGLTSQERPQTLFSGKICKSSTPGFETVKAANASLTHLRSAWRGIIDLDIQDYDDGRLELFARVPAFE